MLLFSIIYKPGIKHPPLLKLAVNDSSSLKDASLFPIGASVNASILISDPLYRKTIKNQFNSVTPENALK